VDECREAQKDEEFGYGVFVTILLAQGVPAALIAAHSAALSCLYACISRLRRLSVLDEGPQGVSWRRVTGSDKLDVIECQDSSAGVDSTPPTADLIH
jgi:hypothetical protein